MSKLASGRPSRKETAIASVQDNKESVVRINVNVPKSFYKKIKQEALNRDLSITSIVKTAINEYISK